MMGTENGFRLSPEQKRKSLKKRALTLLDGQSVRFRLSLAFIICVASVVTCYAILWLLVYLIFGRGIYNLGDSADKLLEFVTVSLSFIISLPLIHGYSIAAGRAARKGTVDLLDMFSPYMDFRMCLESFFVSLMAFLSLGIPAAAVFVCTFFGYKYLTIPACVLLAFPWYMLTSAARLISSLHAYNPELTVRELLALSDRKDRKEYFITELSFIPELLLSVVTVLISGVYRTFAYKKTAEELFAGSIILKNNTEVK